MAEYPSHAARPAALVVGGGLRMPLLYGMVASWDSELSLSR